MCVLLNWKFPITRTSSKKKTTKMFPKNREFSFKSSQYCYFTMPDLMFQMTSKMTYVLRQSSYYIKSTKLAHKILKKKKTPPSKIVIRLWNWKKHFLLFNLLRNNWVWNLNQQSLLVFNKSLFNVLVYYLWLFRVSWVHFLGKRKYKCI